MTKNVFSIKKNNKAFWLYFVVAFLFLLLAVIIIPVWSSTNVFWKSWSSIIIEISVALMILFYLFAFNIKQLKHRKGVMLGLTITEFVILFLIAVTFILNIFMNFFIKINLEFLQVLGLALYIRGVIESVRAYFYKHDTEYKYPLYNVFISILCLSFGLWQMIKPLLSDNALLWIFFAIFVMLMAFCIYAGCYSKPKKAKKKKSN